MYEHQYFQRKLHQFNGCADRIGHIQHGKGCIGRKETGILALLHGFMENFNSVRSAAARCGFIGNQAGIADAAHVNPVPLKIIFTKQLPRILADAIHRRRLANGMLRAIFIRCRRAENRNRRWPENIFIFSSLAISSTFSKLSVFNSQASIGSFSPVAERTAASR
jgi:hypothetical protein